MSATARVEAFSDGVFAIAITLLVLEIQIDPDGFTDLWRSLAEEWPSYLAYVTSFLTVGGVWLAHHELFTRLRFVDPVLMRLNILVLMVAAFLPFPTGLLAEAFHASRDAERAAVVVYGVTAGIIEALIGAMSRYAARHPELLEDGRPAPQETLHSRRGLVPTALYAVGVLIGVLLLPRLAAIAYFALAARAVFFPGGKGGLTPWRHITRAG